MPQQKRNRSLQVANISGRAELLMSVFAITALIHYHHCIRTDNITLCNAAAYAAMVLLSVFSKEQGITVLPISLFLDILHTLRREQHYKAAVSRSVLLIVSTSLLILIRLYINNFTAPKFTELDNPAAFVKDPFFKLASYSHIWLMNLRLLLLPYSLCFDYSMGCVPPIVQWTDYHILCLPTVALLLVVVPYALYKFKNRWCVFGAVFAVVAFLPASNLLVTVGFTVAERVLYLPSVGLCIMVGVLSERALRYSRNMDKIAIAVVVIAMTMTYQRSEEWRSELDLYTSGLKVCPQNAKIHYNLGKVLSRIGNVEAAEHNYWNALRLNPNYEHAMNNLANILEAKGYSQDAERLLRKALRSRPTFAVAWMNLGITLMNQHKYEDSLQAYQKSLRLRPTSADCLFNLGNLFQKMGKPLNALDAWKNATRLDPTHTHALTNMFVVLDELNQCDEVLEIARNIPDSTVNNVASIAFQIGTCLGKNGKFLEAERRLKAALRLNPQNAMYHANLGEFTIT
ncbi:tetratricopeptide repeat protein, partial [Necator americanus]